MQKRFGRLHQWMRNKGLNRDVIGFLDEPCEHQISWSRISIRGWVVPPSKVKWIEAIIDDELMSQIRVGSELRPDVANAYPSIPNAQIGGFNVLVRLGYDETVCRLVVSARTINGNLHQLGKRTIVNSRSAIEQPPDMYSIGLISQCNLSCTMCPAHADNSNFTEKGAVIDPLLLEAALNGLKHFSSGIKRVGLTGWGEPFMYRNMFQVIDRVHQICPNARISITTNGTMFSNRVIAQILDSQLTDIAISLDAGNKAAFEEIRKGAKFEQVVEGTRQLVNSRNSLGRKFPTIATNFVLMRSSIHELPDYVRTATYMGVDLIGTVHAIGLFSSDRSEIIYTIPGDQGKMKGDYTNFIEEAQAIAREAHVEFHLPPLDPSEPGLDCSFGARRFPIIDPSGDVYPCCILQALGNEKGTSVRPMGNIYSETLPEIWKSPSYSRFREAFYTGELPDPHCIKCPKYYNL